MWFHDIIEIFNILNWLCVSLTTFFEKKKKKKKKKKKLMVMSMCYKIIILELNNLENFDF